MTYSSQAQEEPKEEKGPLYADRVKIHPRSVTGFFWRMKNIMLWLGLALYHLSPLLRWERMPGEPDQAILFDIAGERIYFFNLEVWPQDIYILTGVMILAAVGLFLSASLWGRAWCGFLCFQTLWTDMFVKVEALVEGDRNARIKLDSVPLSFEKIIKRSVKHVLWLMISAFFSLSFIWYFNDAFETTTDIFKGAISGWTLVTFLTLLALTYIMAGFAREQVCLYMCPYGRFQGVMFDEHTKVITYEAWRGEDRQKPGKSRDFTNRGHCVDCTLCVQVCPTGIDIREGNQMGCIGCGLCIDACDSIMDKFELPRNLISYDSQVNIAAREARKDPSFSIGSKAVRTRTLVYSFILCATVAAMSLAFANRDMTKLTILKERSPFFVTMSDGQIQNAFTIRVLNKAKQDKKFRLAFIGDYNPDLKIVGLKSDIISVKAGSVETLRGYAKGNAPKLSSQPILFSLTDLKTGEAITVQSVFQSPENHYSSAR